MNCAGLFQHVLSYAWYSLGFCCRTLLLHAWKFMVGCVVYRILVSAPVPFVLIGFLNWVRLVWEFWGHGVGGWLDQPNTGSTLDVSWTYPGVIRLWERTLSLTTYFWQSCWGLSACHSWCPPSWGSEKGLTDSTMMLTTFFLCHVHFWTCSW